MVHVDIRVVARLIGRRTIDKAMRYAHLVPEQIGE
jgi:hypothetical protein